MSPVDHRLHLMRQVIDSLKSMSCEVFKIYKYDNSRISFKNLLLNFEWKLKYKSDVRRVYVQFYWQGDRMKSLFGTAVQQFCFCVKTLLMLRENMQNNRFLFFIFSCLMLLNYYYTWMQTLPPSIVCNLSGFSFFFAVVQFLNRNSVSNGFDSLTVLFLENQLNQTGKQMCLADFFPVLATLSGNKLSTVGEPVDLSFKWCHICK